MYVLKDVLNYYLVHSSAFNCLKRATNVVFFSFCVLVDMPMGGGAIAPPPPFLLATLLLSLAICYSGLLSARKITGIVQDSSLVFRGEKLEIIRAC